MPVIYCCVLFLGVNTLGALNSIGKRAIFAVADTVVASSPTPVSCSCGKCPSGDPNSDNDCAISLMQLLLNSFQGTMARSLPDGKFADVMGSNGLTSTGFPGKIPSSPLAPSVATTTVGSAGVTSSKGGFTPELSHALAVLTSVPGQVSALRLVFDHVFFPPPFPLFALNPPTGISIGSIFMRG